MASRPKSTGQRPNIVILNPDQWRGDVLGHLGNPAAVTPNLDAMAASDSVSFRNAFCQNPICTPSRCSFMTGWYPHTAGHRTQFHMLRSHEPNLLKVLKDSGYYVWWGGKNDLVPAQGPDPWSAHCHVKDKCGAVRKWMHHPDIYNPPRGEPGSDTYYSFYVGRLDPENPNTVFDWARGKDVDEGGVYRDQDWGHVLNAIEFLRSGPPEPFCLFLSLGNPHPPYAVEEPYYSLIDRDALPPRVLPPEDLAAKPSVTRGLTRLSGLAGWTEDRWNELRAVYYGMCARVDDQFGRVMTALQEKGLYNETAVFFFSDHGDFAGDYSLVQKCWNTFQDCLIRVPFVIKPPAGLGVRPGVREALVELVDFPATAYDLASVDPGYTHFGRSLRPVLIGETEAHRDAVFSEGGCLASEGHGVSARDEEDRTDIYWPGQYLARRMPEGTKAAVCRTDRYKYVRRLYEDDELYDLRADPGERVNRANDPSLAVVLANLKDRLTTWLIETGDVVPHDRDRRE